MWKHRRCSMPSVRHLYLRSRAVLDGLLPRVDSNASATMKAPVPSTLAPGPEPGSPGTRDHGPGMDGGNGRMRWAAMFTANGSSSFVAKEAPGAAGRLGARAAERGTGRAEARMRC